MRSFETGSIGNNIGLYIQDSWTAGRQRPYHCESAQCYQEEDLIVFEVQSVFNLIIPGTKFKIANQISFFRMIL